MLVGGKTICEVYDKDGNLLLSCGTLLDVDIRLEKYKEYISYDMGYIRVPDRMKWVLSIRDCDDYLFNEEWLKQCSKYN